MEESSCEQSRNRLSFYESILQKINDILNTGSWIWDMSSGHERWSNRMFDILGLEFDGENPFFELVVAHVDGRDKERYCRLVGETIANKSQYRLPVRISRLDGIKMDVLARGKCYCDQQGNLVRMIGTFQEIGDYRRVEDFIKGEIKNPINQELYKQTFLENLNQEIQCPFSKMLGYSEFVNAEDLTHQEKEFYVNNIRARQPILLAVMSDVITISEVDSGVIKVVQEESNLNKIVAELLLNFEVFADHHNKGHIKLKKKTPRKTTMVRCDADKVKQVLTKLLENAFNFTTNGSVEFGFTSHAAVIEFFVRDTGIGIPTENQERVFRKFVHNGQKTKAVLEGTGLGLAICHGLVQIMQGEIWMESEVNRGTSVFFTIPVI